MGFALSKRPDFHMAYLVTVHKRKSIAVNVSKFLELHVDHQDLAAHQNVVFDPRSCSKLKKLRVVNAAKNRMVDLKPLDLITSLHNLDISHNLLKDLQDVIDVLSKIPGLKVVNRVSFLISSLAFR